LFQDRFAVTGLATGNRVFEIRYGPFQDRFAVTGLATDTIVRKPHVITFQDRFAVTGLATPCVAARSSPSCSVSRPLRGDRPRDSVDLHIDRARIRFKTASR